MIAILSSKLSKVMSDRIGNFSVLPYTTLWSIYL